MNQNKTTENNSSETALCNIDSVGKSLLSNLPKSKQKCYNCKHSGQQFKVVGKTHLHCEHPKWEKVWKETPEKLTAWDTLCEWWDTCSDFEPKQT